MIYVYCGGHSWRTLPKAVDAKVVVSRQRLKANALPASVISTLCSRAPMNVIGLLAVVAAIAGVSEFRTALL